MRPLAHLARRRMIRTEVVRCTRVGLRSSFTHLLRRDPQPTPQTAAPRVGAGTILPLMADGARSPPRLTTPRAPPDPSTSWISAHFIRAGPVQGRDSQDEFAISFL